MKKTIMMIAILFLSACSLKSDKIECNKAYKPYNFLVIPTPPKVTIRVHKEDTGVYKAYIKFLRSVIGFYELQIKDYKRISGANNK